MRNLFFFSLMSIFLFGCVYNVEDELYPPPPPPPECDTIGMSYSQDILPIFEANCLQCHNNRDFRDIGGNVTMEGYNNVKFLIDRNFLIEVIRHDPGLPPMPQGADKLPDCEISKVAAWINSGFPNN